MLTMRQMVRIWKVHREVLEDANSEHAPPAEGAHAYCHSGVQLKSVALVGPSRLLMRG